MRARLFTAFEAFSFWFWFCWEFRWPAATKMGRDCRPAATDPDVELFDGDGFGEVAGLVDVAAAANGNVIGEKL